MSFRGMAHRMAAGSGATVPGLERPAKTGPRANGARPIPTDEEIAAVMELRNIGMGINKIASTLRMGSVKVEKCISFHEMRNRKA